jgi:hypothetical protein
VRKERGRTRGVAGADTRRDGGGRTGEDRDGRFGTGEPATTVPSTLCGGLQRTAWVEASWRRGCTAEGRRGQLGRRCRVEDGEQQRRWTGGQEAGDQGKRGRRRGGGGSVDVGKEKGGATFGAHRGK